MTTGAVDTEAGVCHGRDMRRIVSLGLVWIAACGPDGGARPEVFRGKAPEAMAPGQRADAKPAVKPGDAAAAPTALEGRLREAGLEPVTPGPGLRVALVYATARNFTGRALYDDLPRCWLRPEAARRLADAAARLRARRPELALLVADCTRPVSVQRELWRAHPNPAHVADPTRGTSAHNHGCAVDVTLVADDGRESLELGTGIDEFAAGEKLTVTHEARLCREGVLSADACANRRLLRAVMTEAGFGVYEGEWWHFSGCDKGRYPAVE